MLKTIGVVALALIASAFAPAQAVVANDPRPNFVVIVTDDMRLDDLDWMPHTQAVLGQFQRTQFLSNHPLCCPARAELITGQYGHNNGVFHNSGPFGSYAAMRDPQNTLPTWLHDAGYQTGFVGKWMNGWSPSMPVPGKWDHFNVWSKNIHYPYDYVDWNNGSPLPAGPDVHTNDAVTAKSIDHIEQFSGDPFFVYSAYVAPHGMKQPGVRGWQPSIPAKRHESMSLPNPPYQAKPSYRLGKVKTRKYRNQWRQRVRSLQSVDEGVRDIVDALRQRGELDNTVVMFISDNGFLLGEHGAHGKNFAWEEALRVPFLARGPIPTGTATEQAMILDIAPSIAALAGVTPGRRVDGRDRLFALDGGWLNTLIQAGNDKNFAKHFWWRGMRTPRWTYVHWIGGRKELYDRVRDPYQMKNLTGKRPRVERRLSRQTPNPY